MRILLVPALVLLAGCGASGPTVTVFAASSLKAPFAQIEQAFERQYPGTDVRFSFGGSADLVAQLDQGAPADVLATADEATMRRSGLPGAEAFASNTMVIVVPEGNPGQVTSLADLADPALAISICAPQVPCGAATARVTRSAGVVIAADSEESAVTDVLGKVISGQADAGVAYTSDVATTPGVQGIPIPARFNTTNRYFVAAPQSAGRQFADFLSGDTAQDLLRADGFGPP